MIDKKKLIEKFKELELPHSASIIENFPEEPEIDFDALFEECGKETMAKSFVNFLKSKHLSAPKPKQLPVKKVWTLKKEYEDFVFACGIPNVTIKYCCGEPEHKEFYDYTEEPDYSQVKVGDVVEIVTIVGDDERKYYGTRTNHINENYFYLSVNNELPSTGIKFKDIKSLTILKAAE